MILAEDELAIGTDHAGIIVMEQDGFAPGTPLAEVLPIATDVLVLEITPNRPDCLGIYGVARETHAATGALLKPPPWSEDPGSDGELAGIEIEVQSPSCARGSPHAPSRRADRTESAVAEGAPDGRRTAADLQRRRHHQLRDAADRAAAARLRPRPNRRRRLTIRAADDGETIETLDGQTRKLDAQMVLIADGEGPTSIAGVMGGRAQRWSAETTRVLMEAANWNGPNIHRTSLELGCAARPPPGSRKGCSPSRRWKPRQWPPS